MVKKAQVSAALPTLSIPSQQLILLSFPFEQKKVTARQAQYVRPVLYHFALPQFVLTFPLRSIRTPTTICGRRIEC